MSRNSRRPASAPSGSVAWRVSPVTTTQQWYAPKVSRSSPVRRVERPVSSQADLKIEPSIRWLGRYVVSFFDY